MQSSMFSHSGIKVKWILNSFTWCSGRWREVLNVLRSQRGLEFLPVINAGCHIQTHNGFWHLLASQCFLRPFGLRHKWLTGTLGITPIKTYYHSLTLSTGRPAHTVIFISDCNDGPNNENVQIIEKLCCIKKVKLYVHQWRVFKCSSCDSHLYDFITCTQCDKSR